MNFEAARKISAGWNVVKRLARARQAHWQAPGTDGSIAFVPPPAIAVAILDDLLFTAKIRETARVLGVELTVVRDPSVLHQGPLPILLLLDLNSRRVDPFAALDVVRQRPDGGQNCPAVAFAAAVDKELAAKAKSAGVGQIMDRGQFTERLPEILRSVTRGPAAATS